eukprot:2759182-Prymnesium_polylepis.1
MPGDLRTFGEIRPAQPVGSQKHTRERAWRPKRFGASAPDSRTAHGDVQAGRGASGEGPAPAAAGRVDEQVEPSAHVSRMDDMSALVAARRHMGYRPGLGPEG